MATLPPPVPDVPAAFTATVVEAFLTRTGPRFSLALSGGPTAKLCYHNLATTAAIDWMLVDVYMGDERMVPPDDDDANQHLVQEALLQRVGPFGSFTPMPTSGPVDDCVASYQRTIAALLDGPGLDLIHLGLGPDGHTASLFPGAPTLDAATETLVAATADPNGRNPHPRLTLTLPAINRASCAVFTVSGESKADAVDALRCDDDIPAARVATERIVWLIDDAAFRRQPT